jgi:NAD(P)-dependent dehydrogenase (short-subunit alcohol dehydrogenase family)
VTTLAAMRRRATLDGVSIITGGASGIGLALGTRLVDLGGRVVLADIDGPGAKEAADRLNASRRTGSAVGRGLDVRDEAAVQSVVDETVARHGRLDMLFNNAGVVVGGRTHELTAAHWASVLDVNVRGVVNGVLAAYPVMVEQGRGHIVNTASGAGLVAPPFVTPYATTKHAVVGLSLALRPEAALHGVKVSVLCPGAVESPILDRKTSADLPATSSGSLTGREYLALAHQQPAPADDFARQALKAVERDRAIIVAPWSAKPLWYLHRVSPALTQRIGLVLARRVDRELRTAAD